MVDAMSKLERVEAALAGEPVDRVPFTCWYHFGDQHLDGAAHAEIEHNFFRHYDLDFLNVVNDGDYPRPALVSPVASAPYDIAEPADWHRLTTVNPWEYEGYRREVIALRELRKRLSGEAHFIASVLSPWSTARSLAFPVFSQHLTEHPEDVLAGIEVITTNMERLVAAMLEAGASGIFLRIDGARRDAARWQTYRKFGRPFDLRLLKAAEDAPFNVLHLHGSHIYLSQVADYPVAAFSWADRDKENPSLRRGRKLTQHAVMGGIEHAAFKQTPLAEVRRQVRDALHQTGGRGLILAPGGSLPSDTYETQIHHLRQAVEELSTAPPPATD